MPRRFIHWDDEAVVLYGGVPARRADPPRRCDRGLRSMVLAWDEVERIRLADPFPSVEITYRFERVRQRETVRPNRSNLVDPFASLSGISRARSGRDAGSAASTPAGTVWPRFPSSPWS